MKYFTYFYVDPKTKICRYVGKGDEFRPLAHLKKSSNRQLDALLQKRIREGFNLKPILIEAPTSNSASAMEIFWIFVLGREDLGLGTLFNKTNGGEGAVGRVVTDEQRAEMCEQRKREHQQRTDAVKKQYAEARKILSQKREKHITDNINHKIAVGTSKAYWAKTKEDRDQTSKKKSEKKKVYHQILSLEAKATRSLNISRAISKPCTIDEIKIYSSQKALIADFGSGKNGSRSPNFRFV